MGKKEGGIENDEKGNHKSCELVGINGSLENKVQVGRESRVGELGGSVVVVHKVDPTSRSVPDLPAWRQRTQLLTVDVAQVSVKTHKHTWSHSPSTCSSLSSRSKSRASPGHPGVVPRADPRLRVQEVDLTLLGRPLL